MEEIILVAISLFVVTSIIVVIVLNILQHKKNNDIKKQLTKLDYEKNLIDSAPIVPELSKIDSLKRNDKLELMYKDWKERLNSIKTDQIPKITDMLLEADYSLSQLNYKDTIFKIAKLEMEIYKVRANSEILLNEIKEITTSDERHRASITKLKATYRELHQKFKSSEDEYGEISKSILLQFENIAKKFEVFEKLMEDQEYTEVPKLIEVIKTLLKHMTIAVEEIPTILLLSTTVIPAKIREVIEQYKRMISMGYPLDYLNIEYNIEEAQTKIKDIVERSVTLNLEDSVFELKILLEYFDNVFNDFEKEKISRQTYEESNANLANRLEKINILIDDILTQVAGINNTYTLSADDITLLNKIKDEIETLNKDYKTLLNHIGNNTFAFSKLVVEIDNLNIRLLDIEDKLDNSLDTIGSMRDDENRAREQLKEIIYLLKQAKGHIKSYKLPMVPSFYHVELNEAQQAIKEIMKELEKKPITIEVLNTRVDTARDLVLKLFIKTKEVIKAAAFAEMAIVYGNRYRSSVNNLEKHLDYAEGLFFSGEYQKSSEVTIKTLGQIEPGIYEKLKTLYGTES